MQTPILPGTRCGGPEQGFRLPFENVSVYSDETTGKQENSRVWILCSFRNLWTCAKHAVHQATDVWRR